VFPAAVQVGERISGSPTTTPVLVAWKQLPRERRSDWATAWERPARDASAYGVYALRLDGTSTNNSLSVTSSDYLEFGSTLGLVGLSPDGSSKGYDPMLTTWDQPVVHFEYSPTGSSDAERDSGDVLATWQQTVMLLQEKGSTSVSSRTDRDALGSGVFAGLRSPVSGYEPRRGRFSPDVSMRLTAWCRPVLVNSVQMVQIVCQWSKVTGTTQTLSGQFTINDNQTPNPPTFETTDPNCRVVAVLPYARTVSDAPLGRVVWQADDDIWVAEVQYVLSGSTPVAPVVKRVTPSGQISNGKGKFPTLLTEVSATADSIAWTYAGKVHSARWLP
jgi:hypothetical protein